MKVLYLTYDGLTSHLGQSQILPYILKLSKDYNIKFHIISTEKKELLIKNKSAIQALLQAHNIEWEYILYSKNPPIFSTIYDLLKLYFKAKKNVLKNTINIIHCRSYIPSIIGLRLKRKFGLKFIFDMRGFWADERIEGNIWPSKNFIFKFIYQYFKRLEKLFIQHADAIISLTYHGKDYIKKNFKHSSISVIPCCSDDKVFDFQSITKQEKENLKNKLNISEKDKVLLYSGSLGTWYMLNEMLLFFNCLKQKDNTWKFLLLTNENPAQFNFNQTDIIIKNANRIDMPLYLSIADLGIFFIKNSFSKIASSPIKLGEYLYMGIPIVSNIFNNDITMIIDKFHCGYTFETLNEKDFHSKIEEIQSLINLDKNNMLNAAKEYFSLDKGVAIYYKVYCNVLK